MLFKSRLELLEITLLRSLNARMRLSHKDVSNYTRLRKGFEGEQKSDLWLEGLSEEWLVIHDLLLEYNNSKFQIDSLLISHDKIYPLDIKNFEGDYFVEAEKWYTSSKKDMKNPYTNRIVVSSYFVPYSAILAINIHLSPILSSLTPNFIYI
ncbi:nuclease-related domain-containing protein [Neobacillus sp. KR4-4]|uniref:nuclease-related domain-containing protein n=1 Tax=Neobacillus sp. KR4-4 TaxID=3344872 RepID=UPI0035CB1666